MLFCVLWNRAIPERIWKHLKVPLLLLLDIFSVAVSNARWKLGRQLTIRDHAYSTWSACSDGFSETADSLYHTQKLRRLLHVQYRTNISRISGKGYLPSIQHSVTFMALTTFTTYFSTSFDRIITRVAQYLDQHPFNSPVTHKEVPGEQIIHRSFYSRRNTLL